MHQQEYDYQQTSIPSDPVADQATGSIDPRVYPFRAEFQRKILKLAITTPLLQDLPGLFASRFFGLLDGNQQSKPPCQLLAEIVERFTAAHPKERLDLVTMEELVREAAPKIKPAQREVFLAEWEALRSLEVPDPTYVTERFRQWAKDTALATAVIQSTVLIEQAQYRGKPIDSRAIRRLVEEAEQVGAGPGIGYRVVYPGEIIRRPGIDPEACVIKPILGVQEIALFVGSRGVGKGWIGLQTAFELAYGRPWLGSGRWPVPQPHRVLYVDFEASPRLMKQRLLFLQRSYQGPCPPGGAVLLPDPDTPFTDLRVVRGSRGDIDWSAVDTWVHIIQQAQVQVVILDPWACLHSVNENDNTLQRVVHDALRAIRVRTGCTMWIMHHRSFKAPRQGDGREVQFERGQYDLGARGASAIEDGADVVINLQRFIKHDLFTLRFDKVRGGETPSRIPILRRSSHTMTYSLESGQTERVPSGAVIGVLENLGGFAPKSETLAQEIMKQQGCGRNAALNAMDDAKEQGLVEKVSLGAGKPTEWRLLSRLPQRKETPQE